MVASKTTGTGSSCHVNPGKLEHMCKSIMYLSRILFGHGFLKTAAKNLTYVGAYYIAHADGVPSYTS